MRVEVERADREVPLTILKRCEWQTNFCLRTVGGSAKAGVDFEAKEEIISMEAAEQERTINVKVYECKITEDNLEA